MHQSETDGQNSFMVNYLAAENYIQNLKNAVMWMLEIHLEGQML